MKKGFENFSDKLLNEIDSKRSFVVVGLDPEFEKIPFFSREKLIKEHGFDLKAASETIVTFNKFLIDIAAPLVPAVKPQIAFYEMYGIEGIKAFSETVKYAKSKELIVIEDAKRNDIGNTARAYSIGHLGKVRLEEFAYKEVFGLDAITVNPYLGSDSIKPFLEDVKNYGKGIFVLVKTSNPSSIEIQDLIIKEGNKKLFEYVASLVNEWGSNFTGIRGYSAVGSVVGATFPEDAKVLRKIMPKSIFLVPGYGTQGGTGKDVVTCFNERDGYGAIISASRSINYPHGDNLGISISSFEGLVRKSIDNMNNDINDALRRKGMLPW